MKPGDWSWLEVAKLLVGSLTPVAVTALGIYIHRITTRFDDLQWRSQKLIEKRLSIYDDLAPRFNDLLCYFTYVGSWKELEPPAVLLSKRVIDQKIYLAAPLFSEPFFEACMRFQELCFETYIEWGRDALLRSHFLRRKQARAEDWKLEWDDCFGTSISEPADIRKAYKDVMEAFATDIGVHQSFVVPNTGHIPLHVR
jgi:hypothetical protein